MEKTQNEINKELLERIEKLEKLFGASDSKPIVKKEKMLPEIIKGKKFGNGQEKIAVIVGYKERVNGSSVSLKDISQGWRDGKFDRSFARELLNRAIKAGFVRDLKDGTYDLSQTGEEFYESFTSSNEKTN